MLLFVFLCVFLLGYNFVHNICIYVFNCIGMTNIICLIKYNSDNQCCLVKDSCHLKLYFQGQEYAFNSLRDVHLANY